MQSFEYTLIFRQSRFVRVLWVVCADAHHPMQDETSWNLIKCGIFHTSYAKHSCECKMLLAKTFASLCLDQKEMRSLENAQLCDSTTTKNYEFHKSNVHSITFMANWSEIIQFNPYITKFHHWSQSIRVLCFTSALAVCFTSASKQ